MTEDESQVELLGVHEEETNVESNHVIITDVEEPTTRFDWKLLYASHALSSWVRFRTNTELLKVSG
jgi:hypothetical protein